VLKHGKIAGVRYRDTQNLSHQHTYKVVLFRDIVTNKKELTVLAYFEFISELVRRYLPKNKLKILVFSALANDLLISGSAALVSLTQIGGTPQVCRSVGET